MSDDEEQPRCPRCKTLMQMGHALSRVDLKTPVCKACRQKEDHWLFEYPTSALPDLNNPIPTFDQRSVT